MSTFWWKLPGPASFVSQLVEDLREGKNTGICLPEHCPTGLSAAVRVELGETGGVWSTFRVDELETEKPAQFLFERFVSDRVPGEIWNAQTLAEKDSFRGRIIWLEDFSAEHWKRWKPFILEYAHVCRSFPQFDRTVFCVVLAGELATDPPEVDVCLALHYMKGYVSNIDMELYVSNLLSRHQMTDLRKRLAVSVISRLALWDPEVSDRLASESLPRIMAPGPILEEIAGERGWANAKETAPELAWCKGMVGSIGGEEKRHTAALAGEGKNKELSRRIWNGEVGVLFPFIEERRQEILEAYGATLRVPFTTRFGEVIENQHDLEIGHIEYQFCTNGYAVDQSIVKMVSRLRKVRNDLAHMDPLDPEDIAALEVIARRFVM